MITKEDKNYKEMQMTHTPVSWAGMATRIFALFYGSWLLWVLAAGAATRSYQLRSAGPDVTSA